MGALNLFKILQFFPDEREESDIDVFYRLFSLKLKKV